MDRQRLARTPWRQLTSRPIYENPWIRVREDQVELPDGRTTLYGVVECAGCVGVLPFLDANTVVLVGQYRYVAGGFYWKMPTGAGSDAGRVEAQGPGERARFGHPTGYAGSVEGGDRLGEIGVRAVCLSAGGEPAHQLQPSHRRLERCARRLERLQSPAQMSLAGGGVAAGARGPAGGALGQAKVEGAALHLRELGRASSELQAAGRIVGEHVSLGEERQ